MKRLFFAPFLFASMFSFGGELKAYPRMMNSDVQTGSQKKLSNGNPAYFFPYIHPKEKFRWKDENGNWNTSIEGNFRFVFKAIPFKDKDDCTRFGQEWALAKRNLKTSLPSGNRFYKPKVHAQWKCIVTDDSTVSALARPYWLIKNQWSERKVDWRNDGNYSEWEMESDHLMDVDLISFNTLQICQAAGRAYKNFYKSIDDSDISYEKTRVRADFKCLKGIY